MVKKTVQTRKNKNCKEGKVSRRVQKEKMEMRAGTKRDDIVQQRLWMRHMAGRRQVTALIFALLIASFFMAGCTERGDDEEAGGKLQNQEIGEYALIVGDTIFELGASPEFGDEKESYLMEEFAEEFPFPMRIPSADWQTRSSLSTP